MIPNCINNSLSTIKSTENETRNKIPILPLIKNTGTYRQVYLANKLSTFPTRDTKKIPSSINQDQ